MVVGIAGRKLARLIVPLRAVNLAARHSSPLLRRLNPCNTRPTQQESLVSTQARTSCEHIRSLDLSVRDRAQMSLTIIVAHADHHHVSIILRILAQCRLWESEFRPLLRLLPGCRESVSRNYCEEVGSNGLHCVLLRRSRHGCVCLAICLGVSLYAVLRDVGQNIPA
jgi:hypothetical protein